MKETTKDWLKAAKDDLIAAQLLSKNDDLTNVVAFHCQQSIEKSFKAIIEENSEDIPRTHNLKYLLSSVEKFRVFEIDPEIILMLDSLYLESRYPGEYGLLPNGKPTIQERQVLLEWAQRICNTIAEFLG
jgi:HEPN domain-containing protein